MTTTVGIAFRSLIFFFNDTATTEIYTLSLHDALPILGRDRRGSIPSSSRGAWPRPVYLRRVGADRKSTRLNSRHVEISYAVFCLKKKKKKHTGSLLFTKTLALAPHIIHYDTLNSDANS